MFTNLIPEDLYPILSDYAKILIPSLITYLVTRYTLSRPRKYEIKEKQFNLVYLPLYRLTKQMLADNKRTENISIYIKKVDRLIYKNYQFVFPKTLKLFKRLKDDIKNENQNMAHLFFFEYQIDSDYEKLKRELGYPTDSFLDFFKRLTLMDKILYTMLCFLSVIGVYCLMNSFRFFLAGNIIDFLFSLGTGCFTFFIVYLVSCSLRH